jgi:RNA polymerase sigma factor for flagellar operon FliA
MYAAVEAIDKQRYLQEYAPLVKRMAHHLLTRLPASVQLDDIMQAGMMGLIDAVNRYEESHGTQFETYATQRIRGAMLDELRSNDWLPRSLRKTQRSIEGAISRAEQRLGRAPNESEIAKELSVPLEEYQHMLGEAKGCQLIYAEDYAEDDGENLLDRRRTDDDADPLAQLKDKRFREALVAAIERLPEREKTVMGLYYEQELNLREIAAVLGVTESRVCQLHGQAVTRLRAKLREW